MPFMSAAYDISHDWEEPEDLHAMLQVLRDQRGDANVRRIRYAYYIAEKAHSGQFRKSGEPYIVHPLAVARIVAELRMDDDTIVAALLHDVLEDCPDVKPESIAKEFGEDVLAMVEGVTKLRSTPLTELTARQKVAAETTRTAETLRKMLLAMAKDFRVMVIKLADRLHNMQTLGSLPGNKRIRIATETLDVYAPLAARLGIWQIKWQLEDLAFASLHPSEFNEISSLVANTRPQREAELEQAIMAFKNKFESAGLKILDIRGRPKHLYSIFNKIVKQGVRFEEIYDLLAVRIIVENTHECYMALGLAHDTYQPIPEKFYDYIAKPKPNGYQSLHTKVVNPAGHPMEIQIRTREMHEVAEYGVAAHWTYKEGKAAIDESRRLSTLREQLFDWSTDQRLSSDFLRTVSTDLFAEQTFVFTPKGDVIDLPKDCTPVDFAFRVHTKLGMTLVGAKVNGLMAPLSSTLKNGDVVELITRSNATPSLDWLEFVKSAHTRSKLRTHFRKLTKNVDASRGRDALEKELRYLGLDPRLFLGEEKLEKIAEHIDSCETANDVLAKVGLGMLSVQSVISRLRGTTTESRPADRIEVSKTKEGKHTLATSGIENVMLTRSKCCNPIPGDEVVGYVTRGRGIMIHRKVCPNALGYVSTEPDRLIPFDWPTDGNVYGVPLKVVALNRTGLLMDISTILGESKTNVSALRVKTLQNQTAEIDVTADVKDTEHLSLLMSKISNFSDVLSILRMFGRVSTK